MTMYKLIFLFLKAKVMFAALLLFSTGSFCQKLAGDKNPFSLYAAKDEMPSSSQNHYYLLSWNTAKPSGATVVRQIDERTAIVKLTDLQQLAYLKQHFIITAANNQWKYSPALLNSIETLKNMPAKFIVVAADMEMLLTALKKLNIEIIQANRPANSVVAVCKPAVVKSSIATLKEVIFIDTYAEPKTEIGIIGYSRDFHGISQLDYLLPAANGKNITVGVKEQKMEVEDLDLYKRVASSTLASPSVSNHATVISSIIGGAGNSFYNGRGIANACTFYPSSFSNLFADDAIILNNNKVTVQNHSYGTVIQQFYGAEAVSYDLHTWQNKNFMHVFSAGNSGKLAATDGKYAGLTSYANLTGNFKMAKNIVAVAAVDNAGNMPAESSSGPAYDGRLIPQITALGPNGTSDAAAVVSGTIAIMQQVYADSNNQSLPAASLIKAVLFNTAEDIYAPGIDYKTGYGLINSYEAVKALQQKKYDGSVVSQNQTWIKNIIVPSNAAQIKITLAWTDSVAQVNNSKALINDLDIELTEIASGNIYKPWVLSSAPNTDSLAKAPVRKRDSLNTAEQISIQLPNAGSYQVKVTGTSISNAALPFHIAYSTDTLNTFSFTNPVHTSDVNRKENETLSIRWRCFVADTNQTGNLSISYNNGVSWQLIKQSHKIYSNQYQWQIKDTNSSAVLKMETAFGAFLSRNFFIGKVINTKLDFNCADSFQLSWDKHLYANAYKIFALTDSSYLKPVMTVTDTFKLFKKANYPFLVYAVEPLLSNNIPAARSIASHIEFQGVYCFYKTLYYNLLDGNNVNLILELSAPALTDSIYFERVTAQGVLLQNYGGTKTGSGALYSQFADNLIRGITYFRCKIKLKSGAIIYTDIISVLTSGKDKIAFYPNPVSRFATLNYVLMQGIPADSRFQLFDIAGRLIKAYPSLPTVIDVSDLPAGIIIYKLLGNNDRALATGKLIITN